MFFFYLSLFFSSRRKERKISNFPCFVQFCGSAALRSSHGRCSSAEIPAFIRRTRRFEANWFSHRRRLYYCRCRSKRASTEDTIWECPSRRKTACCRRAFSRGRENACSDVEATIPRGVLLVSQDDASSRFDPSIRRHP